MLDCIYSKKNSFTVEITMSNQLTLKWVDYSMIFWGGQYNHKGSHNWKRTQGRQNQKTAACRNLTQYFWLWRWKMGDGRWKMGSMSEVLWWPLEAEKDKETDSLLQSSEAHSPAHTFIVDFWHPDCKIINMCCFKPRRLWHFITAAMGANTLGMLWGFLS